MIPENPAESRVADALGRIGLTPVARNHVMRRPGGSIEAEVDLVYALGGHTLVVEVSENRQRDARRIKRKKLREWRGGDLFARLSSELGLSASSRPLAVYVDMSWGAGFGEDVGDFGGGPVLGAGHIEGLGAEGPERGQAMLLEWCGA